MSIAVIKKRDGRIVPFDMKKISDAIEKSFRADTEQAEREYRKLRHRLGTAPTPAPAPSMAAAR